MLHIKALNSQQLKRPLLNLSRQRGPGLTTRGHAFITIVQSCQRKRTEQPKAISNGCNGTAAGMCSKWWLLRTVRRKRSQRYESRPQWRFVSSSTSGCALLSHAQTRALAHYCPVVPLRACSGLNLRCRQRFGQSITHRCQSAEACTYHQKSTMFPQ